MEGSRPELPPGNPDAFAARVPTTEQVGRSLDLKYHR
jgi:hypothetical protein